jgi:hypothetical protein
LAPRSRFESLVKTIGQQIGVHCQAKKLAFA